MTREEALKILDEASEIFRAINGFNENHRGKAEIFSVNNDHEGIKIHLGDGASELATSIQATMRIKPVNLESRERSVFIEFEHDGARFWYGEES